MGYGCKVICDSISPGDVRLTTFEVTFPRIVLAEFNTHRVFSRNSASSRAIPVEKRIAMVEADPFIPEQFGKNQKGMQAGEVLDETEAHLARLAWRAACADAIHRARQLCVVGVHKQLANRLLEPFCWQTVVVTATEWSNFFGLRCNPAAQPEIRKIAECMREVMYGSTPDRVEVGGWHLPYVTGVEQDTWVRACAFDAVHLAKISSARCARVSYLTQDGRRDLDEDLSLAVRLESSGHMSPFEHAAQVVEGLAGTEMTGNFSPPWFQLRKYMAHEDDFSKRSSET
jgi:hypothetical protein